jgi:ribosomal-protein-alanine N-acetyltransferase
VERSLPTEIARRPVGAIGNVRQGKCLEVQALFTPLLTARLRLRPPQASDANDIFTRYASDATVTRFVGWPRHRTLADTEAFLAFSAQQWSQWPVGPLLIEEQATGRLLGSSGLAFESHTIASTGYVLAQDCWGQGFASEALSAMITVAQTHRVGRLYALCHANHDASRRVLERCAFALESIRRKHSVFPNLGIEQPQDVCCYGKTLGPSERSGS